MQKGILRGDAVNLMQLLPHQGRCDPIELKCGCRQPHEAVLTSTWEQNITLTVLVTLLNLVYGSACDYHVAEARVKRCDLV